MTDTAQADAPQVPVLQGDLEPLLAQIGELRTEIRQRIDEAKRSYTQAQALYGSPAAQLVHVLEVLGDSYASVEITSPDRDVKDTDQWGNSRGGRQIGETGWSIRLSRDGGPLTIVNNITSIPPTEDPLTEEQ